MMRRAPPMMGRVVLGATCGHAPGKGCCGGGPNSSGRGTQAAGGWSRGGGGPWVSEGLTNSTGGGLSRRLFSSSEGSLAIDDLREEAGLLNHTALADATLSEDSMLGDEALEWTLTKSPISSKRAGGGANRTSSSCGSRR